MSTLSGGGKAMRLSLNDIIKQPLFSGWLLSEPENNNHELALHEEMVFVAKVQNLKSPNKRPIVP